MKNKLVRIMAALAAIACLGTAAYFAGLIWSTEREYQKGDDSNDTLAKLMMETIKAEMLQILKHLKIQMKKAFRISI